MKKAKLPLGYVVYEMTASEAITVFPGGLAVCDYCCTSTLKGYYIPVLNSYYCEKCFEGWRHRAIYYQEDEWFETKCIQKVETMAKLFNIEILEVKNFN